jgi:replication factor C subunit 1
MNSITREQLKELIQRYGGRLTSSVSGKTDILIRGVQDVGPSKYQEAIDKGIPVIDEEGLFTLIRRSTGESEVPGETERVVEEKKARLNLRMNDDSDDRLELEAETDGDRSVATGPSESGVVSSSKEIEAKTETDGSRSVPVGVSGSEIEVQTSAASPTPAVVASDGVSEGSSGTGDGFQLLTEKYRPKSIDELVGNTNQIALIKRWITSFDRQEKKCILISGPPGIGKSTAATLIAQAAGYHVIEFNASDTRNKSAMERIAQDVFSSQTVVRFGADQPRTMRTCVIFDEVDGMSSGDRGGIQALAKFIAGSRIPVICICNDRHSKKLESIGGKLALDIPFDQPTQMEVAMRLNAICKKEGISLNRTQYFSITGKTSGDIRSAVNALQLWGDSITNASEKDRQQFDPLAASLDLIKPGTPFEKRLDDFFVDYDIVPEYVHDNIWFMNNFEGWHGALDAMAAANELTRAVHETNLWDLLPAVGSCGCVLPAVLVPQTRAVIGRGTGFVPVSFGKIARMNKHFRCLTDISVKCSRNCLVPRSAFRDGVAELLTFKFYDLLQGGKENELVALLGSLELTKDDVVELREVVDFELKTFPDPKVLKPSFTRLFNAAHSQSQNSDSMESQRADYFVAKSTTKKRKGS